MGIVAEGRRRGLTDEQIQYLRRTHSWLPNSASPQVISLEGRSTDAKPQQRGLDPAVGKPRSTKASKPLGLVLQVRHRLALLRVPLVVDCQMLKVLETSTIRLV
jgi:hypothetical protein